MGGNNLNLPGGFRPNIRLFNEELHLDPAITRMMDELRAEMAARRTIDLWIKPNWTPAGPDLSRLWLQLPPGPASPWTVPRGDGPATPRPGEISDLLSAIWQVPIMQRTVQNVYSEANRQFNVLGREWRQGSAGDRALMITMPALVGGSAIAALLANAPTRNGIFNLLVGRDISVPGVTGLSFQLQQRGVQVTTPLGIPGLSGTVGGGVTVNPVRLVDYNVMIKFDVTEFLRSRNISF